MSTHPIAGSDSFRHPESYLGTVGSTKLNLIEFEIDPLSGYQFPMGSHLSDPTLVKNDDLIRTLDGRETMGYDQRGSPFDQASHPFLNQPFGFRIHMRGGLVKDEDFGVDI